MSSLNPDPNPDHKSDPKSDLQARHAEEQGRLRKLLEIAYANTSSPSHLSSVAMESLNVKSPLPSTSPRLEDLTALTALEVQVLREAEIRRSMEKASQSLANRRSPIKIPPRSITRHRIASAAERIVSRSRSLSPTSPPGVYTTEGLPEDASLYHERAALYHEAQASIQRWDGTELRLM